MCLSLAFAQAITHPHALDLRITPRLTFRSSNTRTRPSPDPDDLAGPMTCIGGSACSRHNPAPLHMAECSNENMRLSDSHPRATHIVWACSAPVPPGASVSSWTLRCESANPGNRTLASTDSLVIRGSCRLEYYLNLISASSAGRSGKSPSSASSSFPSLVSPPPCSMGLYNHNDTSTLFTTLRSKYYGPRLVAATLTCTIMAVCLITLHRHCCVDPPSPRRHIFVSRRSHYHAIFITPAYVAKS